jgi:hypothetical protein
MPKTCECGSRPTGWMVRTMKRYSYGIARRSVQLCFYSDGRGKCFQCAKKERERRQVELAQKPNRVP